MNHTFHSQTAVVLKRVATIVTLTLLAFSGFAQGYVNDQNNVISFIYFNSAADRNNLVTSGSIASQPASGSTSAGVIDVGLFWSTAAFTDPGDGTLAVIDNMGSTPGKFVGNANFPILGTNPGDVDYFQIYAWDSSFGDSEAGVEACLAAGGYFGAASAPSFPGHPQNTVYGFIGPPAPVTLGTSGAASFIFGTTGGLLGRTVLLTPSPESTTLALGSLGTLLLLLCPRQKHAENR
jgi:hypothetical protein